MTLEFDGIEFGYNGRSLLTGVHMKCAQNQIVGLLGRNGSGKSTLMKIVFGSLRPDIASIRVNGATLGRPGFSGQVVSYLPQGHFLPDTLSLRTICRLFDVREKHIVEAFPELAEDMHKKADQLSGGRHRLFEVLLLLLGRSQFCLLDEPFTGLSPVFIERLRLLIRSEKQKKGIIISDHLYKEVLKVADCVYVLSNGCTFQIAGEEGLARKGYVA